VSHRFNFAIIACAVTLGVTALPQAATAVAPERSLEAAALRVHYKVTLEQARELELAPETQLLAERVTTEKELRGGIRSLDDRVDAAREERREERREEAAYAPSGGTIEGVSLATLNAIAACESGGDPTAVNPAGYYGKYQFDLGTWASVGGSGNPAEASEAEQDYRAALLYSRAGASPWPVCGA
jgi:soluble lytic murein transglycosylase-like protein